MRRLGRYLGQLVALAVFALVVAGFADWPRYTHFPAGEGVLKLSLVHSAKRAGACHRRSAQELAKLAPNMRAPLDCPRGRLPVVLELEVDGAPLYKVAAAPTGLAGDGPSRIYQRFVLPAGPHHLAVRMRDSARQSGFDYVAERDVVLAPRQSLVIEFKEEAGGLVFH